MVTPKNQDGGGHNANLEASRCSMTLRVEVMGGFRFGMYMCELAFYLKVYFQEAKHNMKLSVGVASCDHSFGENQWAYRIISMRELSKLLLVALHRQVPR